MVIHYIDPDDRDGDVRKFGSLARPTTREDFVMFILDESFKFYIYEYFHRSYQMRDKLSSQRQNL
jgi:hypothetical protein